MRVVFIGAGNVARALAQASVRAGHQVTFAVRDLDSDSTKAAKAAVPQAAFDPVGAIALQAEADVVVLATPAYVAAEVLSSLGSLAGVTLVDATNAFQGVPDGFPTMASLVAHHAPGANIVKSFNVVGAEHMASPELPDGGRVFMPVAADDDDARSLVLELASDIGFDAVSAGGLDNAALLEDLARLWGVLAFGGLGRGVAFTLARSG